MYGYVLYNIGVGYGPMPRYPYQMFGGPVGENTDENEFADENLFANSEAAPGDAVRGSWYSWIGSILVCLVLPAIRNANAVVVPGSPGPSEPPKCGGLGEHFDAHPGSVKTSPGSVTTEGKDFTLPMARAAV